MNTIKRYKQNMLQPLEWILGLIMILLLLVICVILNILIMPALLIAAISLVGMKFNKKYTKSEFYWN